jgi:phosphate-selective porin OprO/OprP
MSEYSVKHLAKLAAISATMLAASLPASAQSADASANEEIKVLREQIKLLQARLDAIEQKEAAQEQAAKAAPAPAPAAVAAATTATAAKPDPKSVTATINNKGITLSTADKNYTFSIRPRIQTDAHFFPDTGDGQNEFYMRRLLISFRGTAGFVGWRFTPNFAGSNTTTIDDGWIELNNLIPNSSLVVGKFPGLEGLENTQSNASTLFIERGLSNNLVPSRDIGVKFGGKIANNVVEYGISLTNGSLDGSSMNNNTGLCDEKTVAGLIRVTPFAAKKGSPLAGLTFGIAGVYGEDTMTLDGSTDKVLKYKTSGRNTFLTVNNNVLLDKDHTRINPHLYYYYKQFGFLSEYVSSKYTIVKGAKDYDITNTGWTAQASVVVTGENASFGNVKPAHPFTLDGDGWGAFEVGVRYNALEGDKDLFDYGFVSNSSVQKAEAWGLALKWYFTENLLWAVDFENTDFSGKGNSKMDSEQTIMSRFQIDF